jgi:hypothetical protein
MNSRAIAEQRIALYKEATSDRRVTHRDLIGNENELVEKPRWVGIVSESRLVNQPHTFDTLGPGPRLQETPPELPRISISRNPCYARWHAVDKNSYQRDSKPFKIFPAPVETLSFG